MYTIATGVYLVRVRVRVRARVRVRLTLTLTPTLTLSQRRVPPPVAVERTVRPAQVVHLAAPR